jgi:hypothetical protein
MECGDERQIQFVLQAVSGHTRQPIIGVHQVGTTISLQMPGNRVSKFINHAEHFFFRQIHIASAHVNHSVIWFDLDDFGQTRFPGTCICSAINSAASKCRNEFAHIHIHATTITYARLGERRGVQGEHSNTLHHP